MNRLAFSTVACPDWTLRRVASEAMEWGYEGVELRCFGEGSTHLACDPALTDPAKTARLFLEQGVDIAGIGASSRFDEPVRPPLLGLILGDYERPVREAKRQIDLAEALGAEYVRVFAFEPPPGETPASALRRIVDRLRLVCDHARHRGLRVALENAGMCPRAEQLAEIITRVDDQLLGGSYNIATGTAAGDDPTEAINILGDDLVTARVKDLRAGQPCLPGDGDLPCRAFVSAMATDAPSNAWLVFEWDKMWLPNLAKPDEVAPTASRRLYGWLAQASGGAEPAAA